MRRCRGNLRATDKRQIDYRVSSRKLAIGKTNTAAKRLPHDGRASVQIADRLIDLRIASLPRLFFRPHSARWLTDSLSLSILAAFWLTAQLNSADGSAVYERSLSIPPTTKLAALSR